MPTKVSIGQKPPSDFLPAPAEPLNGGLLPANVVVNINSTDDINSIDISWDAEVSATSYVLYIHEYVNTNLTRDTVLHEVQDEANGFLQLGVIEIDVGNVTNYSYTGISLFNAYSVRVTYLNEFGSSLPSVRTVSSVVDLPLPFSITNLLGGTLSNVGGNREDSTITIDEFLNLETTEQPFCTLNGCCWADSVTVVSKLNAVPTLVDYDTIQVVPLITDPDYYTFTDPLFNFLNTQLNQDFSVFLVCYAENRNGFSTVSNTFEFRYIKPEPE